MSKVVVIADDLTGANALGVLLSKHGYKVATYLNLEKYNNNNDYDIISINTDSRAIEKEMAYERVKKAAEFFKNQDIRLFSKRIDSTLRGNIGAEISALLNNLNNDCYAIVVPSFPSSGRVCAGGYILVNQIPLEKTEISNDPKTPVKKSHVVKLLEEQIHDKVGFIELGAVLKGAEAICDSILNRVNNNCRVIVIDAVTDEDISNIAMAVKNTQLNVISVDPGPFTAALTQEYFKANETKKKSKVMLTIGSVSNLTKKQLKEFNVAFSPLMAEVDAIKLIYDNTRDMEIEKAAIKLLNGLSEYDVIGVTTILSEAQNINLTKLSQELNINEEKISKRITESLAEITKIVLEKSNNMISGLYTSGGDVTVSVCSSLGASAIEVKDEVIPLAVFGRLINGKYDNIPIVTKGGLIGDEKTLIKCIDYLFSKISD
ncbi:MAG: four-carbon acid sugar kinase family protein [Sedimentibacter sp.]